MVRAHLMTMNLNSPNEDGQADDDVNDGRDVA